MVATFVGGLVLIAIDEFCRNISVCNCSYIAATAIKCCLMIICINIGCGNVSVLLAHVTATIFTAFFYDR